jgi:hypothetical protein
MADIAPAARKLNFHAMNVPVRVLLLEVPKLLRHILEHRIQQEADYELVVDSAAISQMGSSHAMSPDVIIVGLRAATDKPLLSALFTKWPGAQVLTIMQTDGEVAVYEINPQRQPVGDKSLGEILTELRNSVQRRRELSEESFVL